MKINKRHKTQKIALLLVGLLLGMAIQGTITANQPNWTCNAEDEVLIIDNTCVHVDEINNERAQ